MKVSKAIKVCWFIYSKLKSQTHLRRTQMNQLNKDKPFKVTLSYFFETIKSILKFCFIMFLHYCVQLLTFYQACQAGSWCRDHVTIALVKRVANSAAFCRLECKVFLTLQSLLSCNHSENKPCCSLETGWRPKAPVRFHVEWRFTSYLQVNSSFLFSNSFFSCLSGFGLHFCHSDVVKQHYSISLEEMWLLTDSLTNDESGLFPVYPFTTSYLASVHHSSC